jgi:hypothetical protein
MHEILTMRIRGYKARFQCHLTPEIARYYTYGPELQDRPYSKELIVLVLLCLCNEPGDRPPIDQLVRRTLAGLTSARDGKDDNAVGHGDRPPEPDSGPLLPRWKSDDYGFSSVSAALSQGPYRRGIGDILRENPMVGATAGLMGRTGNAIGMTGSPLAGRELRIPSGVRKPLRAVYHQGKILLRGRAAQEEIKRAADKRIANRLEKKRWDEELKMNTLSSAHSGQMSAVGNQFTNLSIAQPVSRHQQLAKQPTNQGSGPHDFSHPHFPLIEASAALEAVSQQNPRGSATGNSAQQSLQLEGIQRQGEDSAARLLAQAREVEIVRQALRRAPRVNARGQRPQRIVRQPFSPAAKLKQPPPWGNSRLGFAEAPLHTKVRVDMLIQMAITRARISMTMHHIDVDITVGELKQMLANWALVNRIEGTRIIIEDQVRGDAMTLRQCGVKNGTQVRVDQS